ncbi:MAG: Ldh family oxidoreductase [Clostridia bacterium]|nr:Ldh family oxidoreductase [Clostridia bacterium]
MTVISKDALEYFFLSVFKAEGFTDEESSEIADVLLTADLFGIESHGAQRLMYYHGNIGSGSVHVGSKPEIIQETPVSALVDGHFGMGQNVSVFGMRLAVKKAKANGIGMVSVRNSSHFGIAGYYTKMALDAGLAAFSMTNTGKIMVPTFGREMMLGTNPIAFAMPADPYPFWFDASTTVVTLGKVELYTKLGKTLPTGWAIRPDGEPQTDARDVNASVLSGEMGGLLPLGGTGELTSGHKGYGLGIMVEALTGILSGGLISPEMNGAHGDHTSHFFMAFDPSMFGNPETIRNRMSQYLQMLRDSEKLPGQSRIYTPGEKAWEHLRQCEQNGICLDDATWAEMNRIACELGIEPPKGLH